MDARSAAATQQNANSLARRKRLMHNKSSKVESIGGFILLCIAAAGGHWFITPMRHPQATLRDNLLVALTTIGSGLAAFVTLRGRTARSGGGAS